MAGVFAAAVPPAHVEALRERWRIAFTAAEEALDANVETLPDAEIGAWRAKLKVERDETSALLRALAHDRQAGFVPQPFVTRAQARRLVHLPDGVEACVFNLDGVLVGSAAVHAAAWQQALDALLVKRRATGVPDPQPFRLPQDYVELVHGRPRLEGVRTFLASRGITLPEGAADDPPDAETVHGVANHKQAILERMLHEHHIDAYEGARAYLELLHDAGIRAAVVSASQHAVDLLQQTELADLVDARVDADVIADEHLAARPAPDRDVAACHKLGVEPDHAAVFETESAGIAAGRAGGFRLVALVRHPDFLARAAPNAKPDPDVVVADLSDLLQR